MLCPASLSWRHWLLFHVPIIIPDSGRLLDSHGPLDRCPPSISVDAILGADPPHPSPAAPAPRRWLPHCADEGPGRAAPGSHSTDPDTVHTLLWRSHHGGVLERHGCYCSPFAHEVPELPAQS